MQNVRNGFEKKWEDKTDIYLAAVLTEKKARVKADEIVFLEEMKSIRNYYSKRINKYVINIV